MVVVVVAVVVVESFMYMHLYMYQSYVLKYIRKLDRTGTESDFNNTLMTMAGIYTCLLYTSRCV